MRRLLLTLSAVSAIFVLQFALFPLTISDPFKPNLVLVTVVVLGLRGGGWVLPLAWIAGLLQDSFSGVYHGLNAFSYLAIALLLRQTSETLYATRSNVLFVSTAAATVLHAVIHGVLLTLFSVAPGIMVTIVTSLVPQLLTNLFVVSLISLALSVGEEERVN